MNPHCGAALGTLTGGTSISEAAASGQDGATGSVSLSAPRGGHVHTPRSRVQAGVWEECSGSGVAGRVSCAGSQGAVCRFPGGCVQIPRGLCADSQGMCCVHIPRGRVQAPRGLCADSQVPCADSQGPVCRLRGDHVQTPRSCVYVQGGHVQFLGGHVLCAPALAGSWPHGGCLGHPRMLCCGNRGTPNPKNSPSPRPSGALE